MVILGVVLGWLGLVSDHERVRAEEHAPAPEPRPVLPSEPPPRPPRSGSAPGKPTPSPTGPVRPALSPVPELPAAGTSPAGGGHGESGPRKAPGAGIPATPAVGMDSVERALEENHMLFASSNLLSSDVDGRRARAKAKADAEFERLLEAGRRLRIAGLYDEAVPNLAAILTGKAPEEFQRPALLEMALVAQDQHNLSRALQVYSQYLSRWPQDPSAPEILLRQGLMYRELGLHQMATTKFYATMTAALVVKDELFEYYRRLVLQAQAEIAETLAMQNMHAEASAAFARLLKEESPNLNRARVHYRYIQTLAAQGRQLEVIGQARQFLVRHGGAEEEAEVRFLLATGLKKLNKNSESVREILDLLQMQQTQAEEHPEVLAYWQQRTGNEIANQLYQEGDFVHALDVYESLLLLSALPEWQCPVRYQIGLAYERLEQPAKAAEAYGTIVAREAELGTNAPPGLKATVDMARWRRDFLRWQERAENRRRDVQTFLVAPEGAGSGTSTNSF